MKQTNYTDYEELKRIGMKYYKDRGFCSVIALAVTCRVGFGKAFHTMRREVSRRRGTGTHNWATHAKAYPALGFQAVPVANTFGKTLKSCAANMRHTQGSYLIYTSAHVTAVVDGLMIDWALERGSLKRVIEVYQVIKV